MDSLYLFNKNILVISDDIQTGYTKYNIPYYKNVYWTNFRFNSLKESEVYIGVVIVTSENYSYNIIPLEKRDKNIWYSFEWPIPSIKLNNSTSKLYISILTNEPIQLEVKGVINMFPYTTYYTIFSKLNTYEFLFTKSFEDEACDIEKGEINSIEHPDYIADIIPIATKIFPLNTYTI